MHLLNRTRIHVAIIVVIGLAAYANTLHVPFFFDDYVNLIDTPLIKNLANFTDPHTIFRDFGRRYFGYLSFALNFRLHGVDVTGYHLVNITVHLLAALLVYRLVIQTCRTPFVAGRSGQLAAAPAGFIALFASLLFVAHPIQTQAVTYIVQRFASLAAMLYLLSLNGYIRARLTWNQGEEQRPLAAAWFAASAVAALLSMLTKESAFTLPLVIFLYELIFFTGNFRRKGIAGVATLCSLGVAGVLALAVSTKSIAKLFTTLDALTRLQTDMPRLDYLATQCRVIVTYLRLILFPVGQRVDYDYPIYHSLLDPAVVASAALLGALFGLGLYCLLRSGRSGEANALPLRLAAFGIFWFFITLSIESSVIPIVDVIFEHRMYLPSAGLFMAVAALVSMAGSERSAYAGWPERRVTAAAMLVVLLFAGATLLRNNLWRDEVAFWEDNGAKCPTKGRVFLQLGNAAERRGDLQEAEEAYKKAIDLTPEDPFSWVDLGRISLQARKLDEALQQFRTVLQLDPRMAEAHNNIGKIYELKGDPAKALEEYGAALKLKPYLPQTHENIGDIYCRENRYQEALQEYEKAIGFAPDQELGYLKRGMALLATGRRPAAIADFRRALALNPANAEAAQQLRLAGNGG